MSEPIRVLQVVGRMDRGGIETMIMNLYRNIDRDKVQFDFLAHFGREAAYNDEIRALGGRIYEMPALRDEKRVFFWRFFSYLWALNKFFKEHKEYKVVHGHMTHTAALYMPIAKKYGVTCRIVHSHSTHSKEGLLGLLTTFLHKFATKDETLVGFICKSKHKADIDFDRFWSILRKLHFECVVNCVLTIMVRTGCFDWSEFPGAYEGTDEQVDAFIREVVSGTTAPRTSQEDNTYYEYSKAVMQKSMGRTKYCVYMIKWILRNSLSQMWPEKDQLFALYKVDERKELLLPWLRLRRVFELPVQKIKAGITPKRLLASQGMTDDVVANRLCVFKKLNML